jgi:lysophospholipase L1-like esterase
VELGMNDQGNTPTDKFIANMDTMVQRIRAIGARPVIFSPSPINDGSTKASILNVMGNKRLDEYADALKDFSAKQNIPYADQFHDLLDVWGKNKPNEKLAETISQVRAFAKNNTLEGVEHLRAFVAVHQKTGVKPVSMQGDAVHPGAPGQLMMAASLLKRLGAEPFVSSAAIDAGSKTIDAKGCIVKGLAVANGKVAFDRFDERLPFPIPDEARDIVAFDPTVLEMSQYTLKVTGLKPGAYRLTVDGGHVGTIASQDLAAGVNLTAFESGVKYSNPIAAQGKAVLAAVTARGNLVGKWRSMSKLASAKAAGANAALQLDALAKSVLEADNRIREAATPRIMRFELTHSGQ